MNKDKASWLNWLLYFGSKDERHHRVADRAGHLVFYVAFFVAAVDLFVRFPSARHGAAGLLPVLADLIIILGAGGLYTYHWVQAGITLIDTVTQRRVLRWMSGIMGIVTWGLFSLSFWEPMGWAGVLVGLIGGILAGGTVWLVYRWMDKAARRRVDADISTGPE